MEIQIDDAVLWEADGLWYAQEYHNGKQTGVIEDGSTPMSAYLWLKRAIYVDNEQHGPGKKWQEIHHQYLIDNSNTTSSIGIDHGS